jgi:hypothetical protein
MKKPLACFAVLCELCANVSLFLERIPFAQSSQRTAKLAKKLGFGVVSEEGHPYKVKHRPLGCRISGAHSLRVYAISTASTIRKARFQPTWPD